MAGSPTKTITQTNLQALMRLSNFASDITPERIEALAKKSPDPATVTQAFLAEIPLESEVLRHKWRKTLTALWARHHPGIPALPAIPITQDQATSTYLLLDAVKLIDELTEKPARLESHGHDILLSSRDASRLGSKLESLSGEEIARIRSERDIPALWRLRHCLTATRLVRAYRGELQVVRSRVKNFLRLPRAYQWFILWHVDVTHVCWGEFARDWHHELLIIQDYLPLLWEVTGSFDLHQVVDKQSWCLAVIEAFAPLWGELRLSKARPRLPLFTFFHDSALPHALNQLIINDLLARYGLIQFLRGGNFVWTPLGLTLLEAERQRTLPCGLDLLN